eukprot:13933-Heterococcus_DN1.PRE.1
MRCREAVCALKYCRQCHIDSMHCYIATSYTHCCIAIRLALRQSTASLLIRIILKIAKQHAKHKTSIGNQAMCARISWFAIAEPYDQVLHISVRLPELTVQRPPLTQELQLAPTCMIVSQSKCTVDTERKPV